MQNEETTKIERTPLTPFQYLEHDVRLQEEEEEREVIDDAQPPADPPEEETPTEELEYDVKIAGNPIAVIAKDWVSKGYLPEDFSVTDDITEETLENAYRSYKEALIESEVRSRVLDDLRNQGVDEEILETAKLLKSGIPKEQLSQADAYNVLGSVKLDPNDDSYEGYARQILAQYYADKGFSPDKISRYVERDMDDEDVENLVSDAQGHFKQRAAELHHYFKQVEAQRQQEERQRTEQSIAAMHQYLDKGEIAGRKYTKEQMAQVKRAMFDKTEVVVDAQGNRHRVTAYEKKRLEYQSNFELNFRSIVDFILGYDAKAVEEEGKVKGKSEVLRELNKAVQVTIKGVREVNKDNIERREIA